jgi:hypothetical protein
VASLVVEHLAYVDGGQQLVAGVPKYFGSGLNSACARFKSSESSSLAA